jgi:putative colanic acid biosysnthesis UDP-glucose lipid carrier transferase
MIAPEQAKDFSNAPAGGWISRFSGRHCDRRVSRRVMLDVVCWISSLSSVLTLWLAGTLALQLGTIPELNETMLNRLAFSFAACLFIQQITARSYASATSTDWSQIRIAVDVPFVMLMAALVTIDTAALTPRLAVIVVILAVVAAIAARVIQAIGTAAMTTEAFRSLFARRVAIYGATKSAVKVREAILRHGCPYELVGLFEERQSVERLEDIPISITGSLKDLYARLRSGQVDDVIISLPRHASDRTAALANELRRFPVDVHVCTHFSADFPVEGLGWDGLSSIDTAGLLRIHKRPMSDWGRVLKQVFDRVAAIFAIIVLSPLLLVIASAIKFDSRGPVFFRQRRHGLLNEEVRVWKFRTMSVTEDGAEIRQVTRQDPRVTHIGKYLRRNSLDELPQLFNVLMGEMSLVGPRPHAVAHGDLYCQRLPVYLRRHQVLPGITGWAQVNGLRGETDTIEKMQRRVEHDLWYIRNWSFLLDIKILLLTPLLGFVDTNAY